MKRISLILLALTATTILLVMSFFNEHYAPQSRFCKWSIDQRLAAASGVYEVKIDAVAPYETQTDYSIAIEPCTYTVRIIDTIYSNDDAQSYPPSFKILNVFPGRKIRPACMKPGDRFLTLVDESAFMQGDLVECNSASIADLSKKEYILNFLSKKRS